MESYNVKSVIRFFVISIKQKIILESQLRIERHGNRTPTQDQHFNSTCSSDEKKHQL